LWFGAAKESNHSCRYRQKSRIPDKIFQTGFPSSLPSFPFVQSPLVEALENVWNKNTRDGPVVRNSRERAQKTQRGQPQPKGF
jgi:hypothetical protein